MFSHSFTSFKWKDPVQSEHLRLSKQTNKQTVQHEPAVGALDMQSGGTGCKPLRLIYLTALQLLNTAPGQVEFLTFLYPFKFFFFFLQ